MINFSLPDYTWNGKLYSYILHLQQNTPPHLWYPNRRIDSVYGLPGQLIWGGGRSVPPIDLNEAQMNIDILHNYDIKIKHVCTNKFLNEDHFDDPLCNLWLKNNERYKDSIIVYDNKLAHYIENKYPKYNIILSTTRGRLTPEEHNNYNQNNIETVLFYTENRDENILSQLKYPEKVEIIAAEPCDPQCPERNHHYDYESKRILGILTDEERKWHCSCSNVTFNFFFEHDYAPKASTIDNEWLEYIYKTYGFNNIKMSGRAEPTRVIVELILYYFVQPKYHDILRMDIYKNLSLY